MMLRIQFIFIIEFIIIRLPKHVIVAVSLVLLLRLLLLLLLFILWVQFKSLLRLLLLMLGWNLQLHS